jgi:chromosomal replication initiation ATPase DnaA
MPGQLVFPFDVAPGFEREDFIVTPSNEQAFRFVERWPDWPARAAALHGPKGSGKTHLAKIWQRASHAAEVQASAVREGAAADLPLEAAVLIEDLDGAPPNEARDRVLMGLFESPAIWLLLTGRARPNEWPVVIPDLRSRFDALLAFPLWAPDEILIAGLARRHFAARQLEVPDNVVRRIVNHVERTPAAVAAFVARVDRKAWSEKRAITERLVVDLIDAEELNQPS